jgi:ribonuclease HI
MNRHPLNNDKSKSANANAIEKIKVYSDGSVQNSKVSAAAILWREGEPDHILKLHLGTTEQHTVYKAGLVGMILGLPLIKAEKRSKVKCALNINNQAALVIIKSKMKKSSQHLVASLLQIAKQLIEHRGNRKFKLTLRWTAGHVGIEGNEDADKEAKSMADGESLDWEHLPPCLHKKVGYSLSAICQARNDKLKKIWTTTWTKSPRYCHS